MLEKTTSTLRSKVDWPVWAAIVALAAAVGVAAWLPEKRLWGINHLAFYPVPLRLAALIIVALPAVPVVRRGIGAVLSRVVASAPRRRISTLWMIMVLVIISVTGLVAFRSTTLLMGDGQLVANKLAFDLGGDSPSAAKFLKRIVSKDRIAPGSAILCYLSARIVTGISDREPVEGVRFFYCLLGGIFIFCILWIVLRSTLPAEVRLWLGILAFTSGTMQLFFGYVEYYTPLVLVGTLYVITAFRAIHGRGPLWLPVVLVIAGAYIHIQGILLWPSTGLLVIWRYAGRRRNAFLDYGAPALAVLVLLTVYAAQVMTPLSRFFLPVFGDGKSYGVLTPAHWLDILNELLLVLPAFPLFVMMVLRWRRKEVPGGKMSGSGKRETQWLMLRVEWYFGVFLLFPSLIYLVFFHPEIGMPRDWDLFTIMALGLIPLALLVVNRFEPERVRSFVTPVLLMSGVLTLAWIGVNASTYRTVHRFERILAYDASRADYAYEMLARHYYSAEQFPEAIDAQKKAYEQSHNPRFKVNLAVLYKDAGDTTTAITVLRELAADKPDFRDAPRFLVELLYRDGQIEEACELARQGSERYPRDPAYVYYYGKALIDLGQVPEGISALRRCRELPTPKWVLTDIDSTLQRIGR